LQRLLRGGWKANGLTTWKKSLLKSSQRCRKSFGTTSFLHAVKPKKTPIKTHKPRLEYKYVKSI
jgi:hypothetical protein